MSTLDSILAQLNDEAITMKTASDNSPAPVSNEDAALEAVRAAMKTASAPAPQTNSGDAVAALHKIAADTAAMEDAMMAKQAQDYGALVCDGFMQRLAQYDGAFGTGEKTASVDMEKVAAEAYARGAADFEKQAAAQYEAGYNETMAQVHKIASDLHIAGQSNARQVVAALGGQKTAASMPSREAVMAALKSPTAIGGAAGAGLGALGGAAAADEGEGLQGAALGALGGGLAGAGLGYGGNRLYNAPIIDPQGRIGKALLNAEMPSMPSMPSREAVMGALKSPTAIGGAAGAGLGALGGAAAADEGEGLQGAALGALGGGLAGAGLGYGGNRLYNAPIIDPQGALARKLLG